MKEYERKEIIVKKYKEKKKQDSFRSKTAIGEKKQ